MTTLELIEYYKDLLIVQYETQPNARRTIEAFVQEAIADQIIAQVNDGFNFAIDPIGILPDSAIGAQLTLLGTYRGAQREIFGIDLSRTYFEMPFYGQADADTVPGFALYGQTPITWYWLSYTDANRPIYSLNDGELYRLIQFLALKQSQLLSVENVDDILFAFFGTNVAVFESPTMHLTYIDLISDTDTLFGIINAAHALPRPAGVQVTVIRSETITEFFGFQIMGEVINPTFVGFGIYGTPVDGSFVRYP